jgi:2,3-dihydro-2,3-dihydroxybenzoate dehydrogenase
MSTVDAPAWGAPAAAPVPVPAPVAVVTGAAGGIGRAVAGQLAQAGTALVLLDRAAGLLHDVRDELAAGSRAPVLAVEADVAQPGAVEFALERAEAEVGPVTMAACVAGVLRPGSVLDTSDEDWQHHLDVNTTGVFRSLRALGRTMAPRRHGAIVVVTSNAARVPRMNMAAYAASKAASSMLVRCAGLELAASGVRCNTVEPGSTDTAMQRDLWPDADEGARRAVLGDPGSYRVGIPLGRIAEPEDVARAVVFLLSEQARHITMQSLLVDGGATL